jgi:predicted DNA binding CopG/RHH family protein
MAAKKIPARFRGERQEAEWWAKNQDYIADRFEATKAAGTLGKGSVARLARQRAASAGPSPTITIRVPESDLQRARALSAKKGLRYQTYLKMLLHEALDRDERKSGSSPST